MANKFVGNVDVTDDHDKRTIRLNGNNGNVVLGGSGQDGDLSMKDRDGKTTVVVDGQNGALCLGGKGQDGDLIVKDNSGETTIHLDGQSGEIRIRDWRISVPDYVFDDGYELPDEAQLRAFIAENKHLPGIPSARTVAEEGLGLTRLCLGLLEKVEELTLYTLRQDERLEAMEKRLLELESNATDPTDDI